MSDTDWQFPEGRFLSYVLAAPDAEGKPLYIVLNAAHEEIEFSFPEWPKTGSWTMILDTSEQASGTSGRSGEKAKASRLSVLVYEGRP
jgi:glycogen operon protein